MIKRQQVEVTVRLDNGIVKVTIVEEDSSLTMRFTNEMALQFAQQLMEAASKNIEYREKQKLIPSKTKWQRFKDYMAEPW